LSDLLDEFAELVATKLAAKLRTSVAGMVSHQESRILGPRRHCAAVRRRNAAGDFASARIVGDLFYLTPAAVEEELERYGRAAAEVRPLSKTLPTAEDDTGLYERELLERVSR
jgi:hypothetical protein